MTEKLKTTVIYTKTFNLGNYESLKLGLTKEIYQGEETVESVFQELAYKVDEAYGGLK